MSSQRTATSSFTEPINDPSPDGEEFAVVAVVRVQ
jgi:hypothetical protein